MRKLLHISDLHFGRVDARVVEGLRAIAKQIGPDVIAVSGDLTQRAKKREFAEAREFLQSLDAPKVVVPGNHDVPLYNLAARFLAPLDRFRAHFGDVESAFVDSEIAVVGVNTARSGVFKGGRINIEQVERVQRLFCTGEKRALRILVTHHPFHLAGTADADDLVGRAGMALAGLRRCMPDVLLAGHMHAHQVGTTADRYDLGGHAAIVVQAGTATSTRSRGEQNSFNVLAVEENVVAIERFDWQPSRDAFVPATSLRYVRHELGWRPAGGIA